MNDTAIPIEPRPRSPALRTVADDLARRIDNAHRGLRAATAQPTLDGMRRRIELALTDLEVAHMAADALRTELSKP